MKDRLPAQPSASGLQVLAKGGALVVRAGDSRRAAPHRPAVDTSYASRRAGSANYGESLVLREGQNRFCRQFDRHRRGRHYHRADSGRGYHEQFTHSTSPGNTLTHGPVHQSEFLIWVRDQRQRVYLFRPRLACGGIKSRELDDERTDGTPTLQFNCDQREGYRTAIFTPLCSAA